LRKCVPLLKIINIHYLYITKSKQLTENNFTNIDTKQFEEHTILMKVKVGDAIRGKNPTVKVNNTIADYITKNDGGNHAIREIFELASSLLGDYNQVITERISYTEYYSDYIDIRNSVTTQPLTL
jgi:3-deoxy-D-manno-octulosonate 8-phosphate phosphatase KdsC-like HAD superfamily phosphatase